MIDHRQYIDGIVIELGLNDITVATHYEIFGVITHMAVQELLMDAALRLSLEHGIPFAVVIREDSNEPRTEE